MNDTKPYTVSLWGSNPDEQNDDCWTGIDFATREEAETVFRSSEPVLVMSKLPDVHANFYSYHVGGAIFIEIDGPDIHEHRRLRKDPKPSRDDWSHELAMQAGMAFGCQGYNETMGWD